MIKLIPAEEITSCSICLHCRYDPDYGRSYDSGYDCYHPNTDGKRIADDGDISTYDKTWKRYEASLNTLFPEPKPTLKYPLAFPDWCPLETKIETE